MTFEYVIVLNDLSINNCADRSIEIEERLAEVVKEYLNIVPVGGRLNMIAPDCIWASVLADGIQFQEWLFGKNGLEIDLERLIKRSLDRGQSILANLTLEIESSLVLDYFLAHENVPQPTLFSGPLLAYVGNYGLFSLASQKLFGSLSVEIRIRFLGEDGNSTAVSATIPNVFNGPMVRPGWCLHIERLFMEPASGEKLWALLGDYCCHLEFLDRARRQIIDLEGESLKSVAERLIMMEIDLINWDRRKYSSPQWRSKVTPESKSRIDDGKVQFANSQGIVVDYSDHARFTPGPGRIHFIVNRRRGTAEIAHVGVKL